MIHARLWNPTSAVLELNTHIRSCISTLYSSQMKENFDFKEFRGPKLSPINNILTCLFCDTPSIGRYVLAVALFGLQTSLLSRCYICRNGNAGFGDQSYGSEASFLPLPLRLGTQREASLPFSLSAIVAMMDTPDSSVAVLCPLRHSDCSSRSDSTSSSSSQPAQEETVYEMKETWLQKSKK